jgi:thioredoxin 1
MAPPLPGSSIRYPVSYPRGYPTDQEEWLVATVDLTDVTFEPTVTGEGIVLVDLWAEWCGPCKRFGPVFEAASETHEDIVFAKVDTEAEQRLAGSLGIRSIPTLMAFREGVLVFQQAGALPGSALERLIGAVRDLDMVEVHRKVDEATAAESAGGRR